MIEGKRLYLDANLIIYAVEGVEPWAPLMREILATIDRQECTAVTSELSLAECLVKPFEIGRQDLVQAYLGLLQDRAGFKILPLDRVILIESARLRSASRLRLPDAIHAATAINATCDLLLTNDSGFRSVKGIEIMLLGEMST